MTFGEFVLEQLQGYCRTYRLRREELTQRLEAELIDDCLRSWQRRNGSADQRRVRARSRPTPQRGWWQDY